MIRYAGMSLPLGNSRQDSVQSQGVEHNPLMSANVCWAYLSFSNAFDHYKSEINIYMEINFYFLVAIVFICCQKSLN